MSFFKEVAKFILLPLVFLVSLVLFLFSKKTIELGFASFRYCFVLTKGRSNDFINKIISLIKPKYKFNKSTKGLLGDFDNKELSRIVS